MRPTTELTLCNKSSHRSLQPERACAVPPPQTAKLALELLTLGKPTVKTETQSGCVSSGSGWISGPGGCGGACSGGDPGGGDRELGQKFVPEERLRGPEPGLGGQRGWMPEWGVK